MRLPRGLVVSTVCLFAAACADVDTSSRNTPIGPDVLAPGAVSEVRNYALASVVVNVSETLVVSEQNNYFPNADIVWRGDLPGDRHAQVQNLFEVAAGRTAATLNGSEPVTVYINVVRFHGVTERTRFSVGGNYHVVFEMTVLDAATSAIIEPTRTIDVSLAAPGGNAAVQLEQSGQTERVRVTAFLNSVLQQELTGPRAG